MAKMTIGLFSGSLDRLTAAGVVLSGAAADDMDVEVFVLLQGARAFKKEIAEDTDQLQLSESNHLREEFLASMERLNVSPWLEFFREAKELTNVTVHICGLAGKLWGGEKLEDFVDIADDICGIGEYLTAAEEADIHMFI
ncbi:MAG: DsrE/DsrF/DrsH-like family protein [Candidatus Krumholzibacteriales bacterium]